MSLPLQLKAFISFLCCITREPQSSRRDTFNHSYVSFHDLIEAECLDRNIQRAVRHSFRNLI
ncbi:uncharacterized protein K444DRAFT_420251 [Hyaloscypha bicolor E]|uniref:Uncharacterized protein n=1 Tax=Hyaloscypha bicolor E TaxID=1095630 RepID=A0A2J6T7I8_9HELO|nr:uncharacterized protein K444DRAFT_420251 [Hyaloscypha bicolor E]PMD58977.1 hypothetical protein K444DRAFT_420251 [Hyaloscypha bicolor E]